MPRQRSIPTDFDSRLARLVAADGRKARAGMSRVGSDRRGGAGQQSVLANVDRDGPAGDNAHLLVMGVVGAIVASGGDYVPFDTIVAQHGFATVVLPGEGWVHPVSGVYGLSYEHAWDSFTGGGTVRLELDGTLIPEGVIMDATDGREGRADIAYVAEAGQVGRIHIDHGAASAQTCSAVVRIAITDPKTEVVAQPSETNVFSHGPQSSPSIAGYAGHPSGWTDGDAHWIWHTAGDRPIGEQGWFVGTFEALSAEAVTVEFTVDNVGTLHLNGELLESGSLFTTRYSASATLRAGTNKFEFYAENGGSVSPAAVIVSIRSVASGAVLFRTTDSGGWMGYTAQPPGWTGA